MTSLRPTRADLDAAEGRLLRDVLTSDLKVLFCGINPGLYSAAVGHHFARPGNRFWPALYAAGFTSRLLQPDEDAQLLQVGCGVTNLVARATAAAEELAPAELLSGKDRLRRKVARYRPRWVAILGIGAYRVAFHRPKAVLGQQPELLAGAEVWILPNPSGLNASYQPPALGRAFGQLRAAAGLPNRRKR
jgi:double-stranded uracil-DNA glycosylase